MPWSDDKWDIKSTDFQKERQNYIDSDIMQWGIPKERLKNNCEKIDCAFDFISSGYVSGV